MCGSGNGGACGLGDGFAAGGRSGRGVDRIGLCDGGWGVVPGIMVCGPGRGARGVMTCGSKNAAARGLGDGSAAGGRWGSGVGRVDDVADSVAPGI